MVKNLGRVVGMSAYEVAVKNGYEESESEWLEFIKGEKGDTGLTGPRGEKGDKGDTGDPAPAESVQEAVNNYFAENPVEGLTEIEDGMITFPKISEGETQPLESIEIPDSALYKNLFDKDTMVIEGYAYLTSGDIGVFAGAKYAKIPVEANTQYAVSPLDNSASSYLGKTVAFYNSNFEKISAVSYDISQDTSKKGGTFITPDGTAYIVINLNIPNYTTIDRTDTLMVEIGDTCHDYVPYSNEGVEIDPNTYEITKLFGMGIADLTSRSTMKELVNSIANHNNALYPLKGLKWAVIGDSITEKNLRTSKNYHDYVAENTGIEVTNLGLSGTGYTCNYGSNLKIPERLDTIPDDVDVITVFAGTNDQAATLGTIDDDIANEVYTFYSRVKQTIAGIIERFPSIPLGVITPIPRSDDDSANLRVVEKSKAIKEVCKLYNVPCLDLNTGCGMFVFNSDFVSSFIPDGLHPNADGHKRLAKMIEPWLKSLV